MKTIRAFLSDEEGLETIEYAIITALIVVTTVAVMLLIGSWVLGAFTNLNGQLP